MASSNGEKAGRLVLYDALAAPRQQVTLVAALFKEGFLRRSPIGGEVVIFQHEGRSLGQALTGGDGRAMKAFAPARLGIMTISAKVAASRRVTAADATARVFVWEKTRPLAVISIPALWRRSQTFLPVPGQSESKVPEPETKAVDILSKVAAQLRLMYLSGSEDQELQDLREWADQHHLPAGPIFVMKRGPLEIGQSLDRLRRDGWKVRGGVVGSPEEAKVLLARDHVAIASPATASREKWPEKTIRAKDWDEVGKRLLTASTP